ncbi:aminopeptidase P family protein [Desulfobulbus rhabdoformis]|jgi:Xaa-Pro aminopeptidase|uniref:M24 family metallopeptidase n=1 Tax=Desulfobulbus rhabdoformis TaxID=34032 RepID=UPI00196372BB|nr:Xaa-Pro peptidase family protein [Desulfobulbus rhabdoformis]MBM9616351.1 aminopeptidase P family protein [Desulfobulbus rhabdoformis]
MSIDPTENNYHKLVPETELEGRAERLQDQLRRLELDAALLFDPIHMYYFSGTIQQGVVVLPTVGKPLLCVRRSVERARIESSLQHILPLSGLSQLNHHLQQAGIQTKRMGVMESNIEFSFYKTLSRTLPQTAFSDISGVVGALRSVKSDYEVALVRRAGEHHQLVYDLIPTMIHKEMSEWELGCEIQHAMMRYGYTGMARFSNSTMELFLGYISAGDSANYPTGFMGPGGAVGLCPTVPYVGSKTQIEKNQPIYIDTGFGYRGYHTDKTRIFSLGSLSDEVLEAHAHCLQVEEAVRRRLKPGAIPAEIYAEVMETMVKSQGFEQHFMGYGTNQVPFLGHGIGLAVDECPVIAANISTPLQKNMILAVEPKKALPGIGMVGIENTYLVTEQGGENLTPGSNEVVLV